MKERGYYKLNFAYQWYRFSKVNFCLQISSVHTMDLNSLNLFKVLYQINEINDMLKLNKDISNFVQNDFYSLSNVFLASIYSTAFYIIYIYNPPSNTHPIKKKKISA